MVWKNIHDRRLAYLEAFWMIHDQLIRNSAAELISYAVVARHLQRHTVEKTIPIPLSANWCKLLVNIIGHQCRT